MAPAMSPPPYGGDTELCKTLPAKEVENTFFYRGPLSPRDVPSGDTQAHWDIAKDMCLDCPFYLRCRENTLGEPYGVWGGRDQYDRFLERRRLLRGLAAMSHEDRAALAARLHAMHSPYRGMTTEALARRTGYSEPVIKAMLEEHEQANPAPEARRYGVLSDEERKRLASMASKGTPMRHMTAMLGRSAKLLQQELAGMAPQAPAPSWPSAPPPGDGWVWHNGHARSGSYLGQTEDSLWIYMALRSHNAPTRRWFIADHVQMRKQVCVQILEWAGRESRERAA